MIDALAAEPLRRSATSLGVLEAMARDAHGVVVRRANRESATAFVVPQEGGGHVAPQCPLPRGLAATTAERRGASAITRQAAVVEAVIGRLALRAPNLGRPVLHGLSPRWLGRASSREAMCATRRVLLREPAGGPCRLHASCNPRSGFGGVDTHRSRSERVSVLAPALPVRVAQTPRRDAAAAIADRAIHECSLAEVRFVGDA